MVGDKFQLFIRFIAWVFFKAQWQTVGITDRLSRFEDDFFRGFWPHVGKVTHDADAVHFRHHFTAITGKSAIAFVTACTDEVLCVVRHLGDAYTELFENLDIAKFVFKSMNVLETEHDSGFPFTLGSENVISATNRADKVAIFLQKLIKLDNVVNSALKALPHRHGTVGGSQPPFRHVLEQCPIPFCDD